MPELAQSMIELLGDLVQKYQGPYGAKPLLYQEPIILSALLIALL